jgi:hypothetical protein
MMPTRPWRRRRSSAGIYIEGVTIITRTAHYESFTMSGAGCNVTVAAAAAQLGRKKVAILNAQYQKLLATQAFVQASEVVEGSPSPAPRSAVVA